MKIEIKHKTNKSVLFACEAVNVKLAVLAAIKLKVTLRFADLRFADLRSADLRFADLISADLSSADLRSADLRFADLRFADLRSADLRSADLRFADLSTADLDFSCWPLFCGSNHVKVDVNIAAQLAAHFCVLDCEDEEYQNAKEAVLSFALKSHRSKELGLK